MAELLLITAIGAIAALVVWLRYRGTSIDNADDALTRACSGDRDQAQRLEDLEHRQASQPLSRKEARTRALEKLIDDRSR